MSFAKNVKEEIIKKSIFKEEPLSLLQGLFLSAGSLVISNSRLYFLVSNENENVINLVKNYLEKCFDGVQTNIIKVVKNFKQKERFEISVESDESNDKILKGLGIIKNIDGENEISDVCDKSFMASENKMLAFLIGMFLGAGTISIPSFELGEKKYGYHFEIVLNSKNQADVVCEIFSMFDIFAKQVNRNEQFVVYLKNNEVICDILLLFGADKSYMNVTAQKISRDMNNKTNRQMNCYTANMDKSMNAAVKQMIAIETIQNTIGIENLPENLIETALARLSNPEASLKDLLSVLDNKITKGALSQRFNKIIEIANSLGDDNE